MMDKLFMDAKNAYFENHPEESCNVGLPDEDHIDNNVKALKVKKIGLE